MSLLFNGRRIKVEEIKHRNTFIKTNKQLHGTNNHEVVIAIRQSNLLELEKLVLERSTPGNKLYQNWLTHDEVNEITRNDGAAIKVINWLETNDVNITWKSHNSYYIKAETSISKWEELLQTTFYIWEDKQFHTASGESSNYHIRSEDYSLPHHLVPHISAIFNTCQSVPRMKHMMQPIPKPQNSFQTNTNLYQGKTSNSHFRRKLIDDTSVTIPYLKEYYYIPTDLNGSSTSLEQAIFMTTSGSGVTATTQYYSPNDLQTFQSTYGLIQRAATANEPGHSSDRCDINECSEGNLDLQYIMGIAEDMSTIYWHVDSSSGFVGFVTDLADNANPPSVFSISWGSDENSVSQSTMDSFNTEAMKVAAMGVTLVVASGDDGANAYTSAGVCECLTASFNNVDYSPSFPATSQYVTAVGATMGSESDGVPRFGAGERVCQSNRDGGVITSGGGFSSLESTPSWQQDAVDAYFKNVASQPVSGYATGGRGYPDVSLVGAHYEVIIDGQISLIYGTSASAPVFAGMVSLINVLRVRNGSSTVGWLNPTLYASDASGNFNDITTGDNKCCRYSGLNPDNAPCCSSGFNTATGWDPVTGLGSIYFPQLSTLLNQTIPFVQKSYPNDNAIRLSTTDIVMISVFGSAIILFCLAFWYRMMTKWKFSSTRRRPTPANADRISLDMNENNPSAYNNQSPVPTTAVYATEEERIIAMQEKIMNQNRAASPTAPVIYDDMSNNNRGRNSSSYGILDYGNLEMAPLWEIELNTLADMGFTDTKRVLPVLNKFMKVPVSQTPELNGVPVEANMQRVINALVTESY